MDIIFVSENELVITDIRMNDFLNSPCYLDYTSYGLNEEKHCCASEALGNCFFFRRAFANRGRPLLTSSPPPDGIRRLIAGIFQFPNFSATRDRYARCSRERVSMVENSLARRHRRSAAGSTQLSAGASSCVAARNMPLRTRVSLQVGSTVVSRVACTHVRGVVGR